MYKHFRFIHCFLLLGFLIKTLMPVMNESPEVYHSSPIVIKHPEFLSFRSLKPIIS